MIRDIGSEANAVEVGVQFEERLKALKRIDKDFASHPMVLGRLVFGTDAIWNLKQEQPALEVRSFRDYKVYPKSIEEERVAEQFFPPMFTRIGERLARLD